MFSDGPQASAGGNDVSRKTLQIWRNPPIFRARPAPAD